VAVILRRDLDSARARRLHGQRINGKRVLGVDRFELRRQERARGKLQHVVRPVTEHDRRRVDREAAGERLFQLEAIAIRIAREIDDRTLDRPLRERGDADRILVGRQLDDAGFGESQLAGQLEMGLPG
jgi:hypothetical protein